MAEDTAPAKEKKTAAGAKPRCPMCGKPQVKAYRPFCSQRCADLDLGRWLTGEYRIAAVEEEADFDEEFFGEE